MILESFFFMFEWMMINAVISRGDSVLCCKHNKCAPLTCNISDRSFSNPRAEFYKN